MKRTTIKEKKALLEKKLAWLGKVDGGYFFYTNEGYVRISRALYEELSYCEK